MRRENMAKLALPIEVEEKDLTEGHSFPRARNISMVIFRQWEETPMKANQFKKKKHIVRNTNHKLGQRQTVRRVARVRKH